MAVQQINSAILEWLILSGHEHDALKLWEELGYPEGVDGDELWQRAAVKQAIRERDYERALATFSLYVAAHPDGRPHAEFRLSFARLVTMITQRADAMQIILYARDTVNPLIAQLASAEQQTKYTELLNAFMALLVLPESAAPPGTAELRDEQQLQAWVLEGLQQCFHSEQQQPEARLETILRCYQIIAEERA